jgi:hypothetical protein
MTIEEIKDRLEKVENAIFYETMADFMDWDKYYKLKREERELKEKIKKMGE